MKFRDLVHLALSNLFRRKFRTFMTVLGVVIGTASIVCMLSLGYGLRRSTLSEFEGKKSLREIIVRTNLNFNYSTGKQDYDNVITDETVELLKQEPEVKLAIPVYSVTTSIHLGSWEMTSELIALDDETIDYYDFALNKGTMPQKGKSSPLQILMGLNEKNKFYNMNSITRFADSPEGSEDLSKKLMRLEFYNNSLTDQINSNTQELLNSTKKQQIPIQVTGLVAEKIYDEDEKDNFQIWSDQFANNCYVYKDDLMRALRKYFKSYALPNQKASRKGKPAGDIWYSHVVLVTEGPEQTKLLYDRLKEQDKYLLESQIDFVTTSQETLKKIQLVLGAIGGISLLVAAIGIANTMMMSIYERTKEIGIFKVLGCDLSKIRNLIIFESSGIGIIGGIMGVIISYLISSSINKVTSMNMMATDSTFKISYIPTMLAILSILFAGLVGTLSGLLPAIRAMKLSPLKAIRNE